MKTNQIPKSQKFSLCPPPKFTQTTLFFTRLPGKNFPWVRPRVRRWQSQCLFGSYQAYPRVYNSQVSRFRFLNETFFLRFLSPTTKHRSSAFESFFFVARCRKFRQRLNITCTLWAQKAQTKSCV